MIHLRLSELAGMLGLPAPSRDVKVEQIVADSRQVDYGSLFAALQGSRVDGHDFAAKAVELGAVALLVSRPLALDVPQLVVPDVLRALGRIARELRLRLDPKVVGITGSNGKTTVKEMITAILRQQGDVLSTRGNYNNELGVPLSLFGIEQRHRYAVLEMGASQAGDIAYLADITRPDVGLITNIGPAHLQGFGSEEGVARAKGELYAALQTDGWAIMNGDEPWLEIWRAMSRAGHAMTFGTQDGCDVRPLQSGDHVCMRTPAGEFDVQLALPGRHNLVNAASATAAALALGIDNAVIRAGLEAVKPVPGRLNVLHAAAGWSVIDDTYNANPASLYSALQYLSGLQGKPWLVLGDMKELGETARKLHREVGDAARALGVRRVFTVGELSAATSDAFGEGAQHFTDREALAAALREQLKPGVICLVKGSRSMGMEAVVRAIIDAPDLREAS